MDKIKYLWIGFKNAYSKNIENEYPVFKIWEIQNKINKRFEKIDYETSKKIKKHSSIY